MKTKDITRRVNELINLADEVLSTKVDQGLVGELVNHELFIRFRTLSLSFIASLFGEKHIHYKEFNRNVLEEFSVHVYSGRGILTGIKNEIEGGWLFSFKDLVSAEIFSDFLEMSEYFLKEGYKDPAAVMIGSVLEEHLRQLCQKNNIPVETIKNGDTIPKKADLLNSELAAANVYNKLDQKGITSWLDLRNKAAHGKYSEYTKVQVDLMYQSVSNFISRVN